MQARRFLARENRHRAELFELLDPALRLLGLAGLGLEPVDEGLEMGALCRDLVRFLLRQHRLFRPLPREQAVIAAIEGHLAAVEMQDGIADRIEEFLVMADDEQGMRIAFQMRFQPDRAFDVEIVGWFVEQQQVWLKKQHRREADPHPPATGKIGARPA